MTSFTSLWGIPSSLPPNPSMHCQHFTLSHYSATFPMIAFTLTPSSLFHVYIFLWIPTALSHSPCCTQTWQPFIPIPEKRLAVCSEVQKLQHSWYMTFHHLRSLCTHAVAPPQPVFLCHPSFYILERGDNFFSRLVQWLVVMWPALCVLLSV